MFSKYCSLVFSWLMVGALAITPLATRTTLAAATKQEAQEAKYKKRIVEWGTNKNVSVKLKSGSKIEGRIADIQDAFFAIQSVTKDGKVATREIVYSDVNKVSGKDGGKVGKVIGYTALGVLAGVGVVVMITLAVWANN